MSKYPKNAANEHFSENIQTLLDCICWECYSFGSLDEAYVFLFSGTFNDALFDNDADNIYCP